MTTIASESGMTKLRNWPRAASVVALALLLCGCAQQRRVAAPTAYEREAWSYRGRAGTKLVTPHYEVYTTLKDQRLVASLPDMMERSFEQYAAMIPPVRTPRERMKVYIFATRGEWADFTRRFTGKRAPHFLLVRNGGYSEAGVSVIQFVRYDTTFPIVAHEGLHQYLHHYVSDGVPAWLNEGLAVQFEGQRWESDGLAAFEPWRNAVRRNQLAEALAQNKLISLKELLETNAGKIIQGPTRRIATYYAQLWALVLFIREGADGKYADGLNRLLSELAAATGPDRYAHAVQIGSEPEDYSFSEALFRIFITEDIHAFEREYLEFMRARILGTGEQAAALPRR